MNIPTIFDWADWLQPLRGWPMVVVALATAVLAITVWEWRGSLAALTVHYLAFSVVYLDVLPPHLALARLLTGMFVCLVLLWGGRQLVAESGGQRPLPFAVRLLGSVGVLLLAWAVTFLPVSLPFLADAPPALPLAIGGLVALGLLAVVAGGIPWRMGLGLLLLLNGADLLLAAAGAAPGNQVWMAVAMLATAVAIALITAFGGTAVSSTQVEKG